MKNLLLLTQVAFSFLGPIFVGLYIGRKIDEFFNLNGIFSIILMILGVISGFLNAYNLIMTTNRTKKNTKKEDQ